MDTPADSNPLPPPDDALPDETPPGGLRSPIRPTYQPEIPPRPAPGLPSVSKDQKRESDEFINDPQRAMASLRRRMQAVVDEFAQGKINRAQFNAVYGRYSEQRTIIERLLERNPQTEAWKQVIATRGQTGFLRTQYQAQPLYYALHLHHDSAPLTTGGSRAPDPAITLPLLRLIWSMPQRPQQGLGRKALPTGEWLILATGEFAATLVVFSLEPSIAQARLVRDLHFDFERANGGAIARGITAPERMVFPQRALIETSEY